MTWNLPNLLTLLRLLAAPGVAVMFLYFHRPWADWFAQAGEPRLPRQGVGPAANMPALAIDMAVAGMGVALGQEALAAADIRSGRLIAVSDVRLSMPNPYTIVTPRSARRKKRLTRMVDALVRVATPPKG